MAGGQALDLMAEDNKPDEAGIITLQAMKTGALIRFACEAGAIIAGASREDRERMAEFGSAIGLAFQLADDLLDVTADAAMMGKATGKMQPQAKRRSYRFMASTGPANSSRALLNRLKAFWNHLATMQPFSSRPRASSQNAKANYWLIKKRLSGQARNGSRYIRQPSSGNQRQSQVRAAS